MEENQTIHSLETDLNDLEEFEDSPEAEAEEEQTEQPKEDTPKKKSRAQRRIERLIAENKALRESIKPEVKQVKEINIDDYETYEEYQSALDAQKNEPTAPTVEKIDKAKLQAAFSDGSESYENFVELVSAKDLDLSEDLIAEILDTDAPSDILYYLAKNKEEATRLSKMSKRKMIVELSKIETMDFEEEEEAEVVVKAKPKPIVPISNSTIKGKTLDDENLSFKEHEALLNARKRSNIGGFI